MAFLLEEPGPPEQVFDRGAASEKSGFGDMWDASRDYGRYVASSYARRNAIERAIDERISEIRDATGRELANPLWATGREGLRLRRQFAGNDMVEWADVAARAFDAQTSQLAGELQVDHMRPSWARSVAQDARVIAQKAVRRNEDISETNGFLSRLLPGVLAGVQGLASGDDPLATLMAPLGGSGTGATALHRIVTAGLGWAAANGATEAALQPFIQDWRREIGEPSGVSEALHDIGMASVAGGVVGAGGRAAFIESGTLIRGRPFGRAGREQAQAATGGDGIRPGDTPEAAAPQPAATPSPANPVPTADLLALAEKNRGALQAEVRGALDELRNRHEIEASAPPGVPRDAHFEAVKQAERFIEDPAFNPPPVGVDPLPPAPRGVASGEVKTIDFGETGRALGKPYHRQRIGADAMTFEPDIMQYKRGGDARGVTDRLSGVQRWDELAAGQVFVFERADGRRVVADGHQRTGLAQRLIEKMPQPDPLSAPFKETRGAGQQFHGSGQPINQFYEGHFGNHNIYGNGFYTTDAVDVAHGYAKNKGKSSNQFLYEIKANKAQKILDMEAPLGEAFLKKYVHSSDLVDEALAENPKTIRDLFDEMRAASSGLGISKNDVMEIFDGITYNLEKDGYTGMAHRGGLRTNTKEHAVTIYFNPQDSIKLNPTEFNAYRDIPVKDTIRMDAIVFKEADGWTPAELRALAAKRNIQQETGDVIDTATILREAPQIVDDTMSVGREHLRIARALSRLSDDAFAAVRGGVVKADVAAAIGEQARGQPHLHMGLIDALAKRNVKDPDIAAIAVRDAVRMGAGRAEQHSQMALFDDALFDQTLVIERATILDATLTKLGSDAALFKRLGLKQSDIEKVGNVLEAGGNAQRAALAQEARQVLTVLATRDGTLSNILDEAAKELAAGGSRKTVTDKFAAALMDAMETHGALKLATDGGDSMVRSLDPPQPRATVEPPKPEEMDLLDRQTIASLQQERPPEMRDMFGELLDMVPIEDGKGGVQIMKIDEAIAKGQRDAAVAKTLAGCIGG